MTKSVGVVAVIAPPPLQRAIHPSIRPKHSFRIFQQSAVAGKYYQLGEVAVGSAAELSGTIIIPFGAYRGRLEPNAFENALFYGKPLNTMPARHIRLCYRPL